MYTKAKLYTKEFLTSKELLPIEDIRQILSVIGYNSFANGKYTKEDPYKWSEREVLTEFKKWKKTSKELLELED